MKEFFKPEDFEKSGGFEAFADREIAADFANEKLQELIESWPVVYTGESYNKHWIDCETMHTTKKARLAFIEEIAKKECVHEPEITFGSEGGIKATWPTPLHPNIYQQVFVKVKCLHCGKELTPTWSEK